MASATFKLDILGLKELRAKIRGDELYANTWHGALDEATQTAAAAGRSAAPRGASGSLAASVTGKLSAKATVMSGRVTATARHDGYPYGKLLEYAPKYHHKGWLVGAVQGIRGQLTSILDRAAKTIEANWSR